MRTSTILKEILFITLFLISNCKNIAQEFELISDTITTETGLKYAVIAKGDGPKVELNKEVAFHWTGFLANGENIGTSRGSLPFYYVPGKGQVIKGAEEGLSKMHVGDRFMFIMPPNLAYGEKGAGKVIPPNETLTFDYEVISVTEQKLSLLDTLYYTIVSKGITKAIEHYYFLKENQYDNYFFREDQLNNLGYKLVGEEKLDIALEIFKLNLKEYPESWNVYDSLGELYFELGDTKLAIENYKKSVEINPDNNNAINVIKKLKTVK